MNQDIARNTLTNVVIVIERIFKYLNARQLNVCARVCKAWLDQARRERQSRPGMKWNCFIYSGFDDEDLDEDWWRSIMSYLLESPIQPQCLIIFCTETLWRRLLEQKCPGKKRRKTKQDPSELFVPFLPKDCVYHVIITDGLIGTDANMVTTELGEYDVALSFLMFKESPSLEFLPFSLTHAECLSLAKCWAEGNSQAPSCMQSLMCKQVKMINLYCPMSGIDQEIGYSLCQMFHWPMIAGGYVNERLLKDSYGHFHSSEVDCILSGIAVCGHKVMVASVLIRSDINTEKEVDSIMQQLAEKDFPLHKSFGLMYACVGRGIHVYNKHNVESSIFRKYFPKTPLFGFFGNGEIGCNYPLANPLFADRRKLSRKDGLSENKNQAMVNDDNSMGDSKMSDAQNLSEEAHHRQQSYNMKHPPKLFHAYTTVMCLVALP